MIQLYALIDSETGVISNISEPGMGKSIFRGLKSKYIEVEVSKDAEGKITLIGDKALLIKDHNWAKVKEDRRTDARESITLDGVEFGLDSESFETMKDLVLISEPAAVINWKVKDGTIQPVTREQLMEVIKMFVERRQDGYEASWEVEAELVLGRNYKDAKKNLKDKMKDRKKTRDDKKKKPKP